MRTINYIIFGLLLLVSITGCNNKSLIKETVEVSSVVISMDMYNNTSSTRSDSSYSLQNGVLGSAEYTIDRLRVYVFASDGTLDKMEIYDNLNANHLVKQKIEVPKDVSKELYFIANEPIALSSELDVITSTEQLESLNFEIANAMNSGFNGDATFLAEDYLIPMSAKYSVGNAMVDISINVGLTRAVARVDLYLHKADNATSRIVELSAESSFGVSGVTHSSDLFEGEIDEPTDIKKFDLTSSAITLSSTTSQRVLSFYIAERTYDYTNPNSKIMIEIDGLFESGVKVETKSVILGDNGKLSTINRNHVYRISGVYNGVEIVAEDLEVMDWYDVEVDAEIEGVMVAVDSEVAMDWLRNGNSYTSKSISFGSNKPIKIYLPTSTGSSNDLDYEFKLFEFDDMNAGSSYSLKDIALANNYIYATSWIESAIIHFTSPQSGYLTFTYTPSKVAFATHSYPIRIKSDNVTKQMMAIYDNGYIPASLLSDDWANRAPGGVVFAKRGEAKHPLSTPEILKRDNDGYYRGEYATTADEGSRYCSETFGEGWYMPSYSDMVEIAEMFDILGASYRFQNNGSVEGSGDLTSSRYWTSSASSSLLGQYWSGDFMRREYMNQDLMERKDGSNSYYVRCVMDLK